MSEPLERVGPIGRGGKWIIGLWRNSWSNTMAPALDRYPAESDWNALEAKHVELERSELAALTDCRQLKP
jgi:hypothetical protein